MSEENCCNFCSVLSLSGRGQIPLLTCESCSQRKKLCCVIPSLHKPVDDYYCDACSKSNWASDSRQYKDNIVVKVAALAKDDIKKEYNNICWAWVPGKGNGWWPCIVIDPRIVHSNDIRELVRPDCDKKHLVFLLGNLKKYRMCEKIYSWDERSPKQRFCKDNQESFEKAVAEAEQLIQKPRYKRDWKNISSVSENRTDAFQIHSGSTGQMKQCTKPIKVGGATVEGAGCLHVNSSGTTAKKKSQTSENPNEKRVMNWKDTVPHGKLNLPTSQDDWKQAPPPNEPCLSNSSASTLPPYLSHQRPHDPTHHTTCKRNDLDVRINSKSSRDVPETVFISDDKDSVLNSDDTLLDPFSSLVGGTHFPVQTERGNMQGNSKRHGFSERKKKLSTPDNPTMIQQIFRVKEEQTYASNGVDKVQVLYSSDEEENECSDDEESEMKVKAEATKIPRQETKLIVSFLLGHGSEKFPCGFIDLPSSGSGISDFTLSEARGLIQKQIPFDAKNIPSKWEFVMSFNHLKDESEYFVSATKKQEKSQQLVKYARTVSDDAFEIFIREIRMFG